jgi:hypothetical protein
VTAGAAEGFSDDAERWRAAFYIESRTQGHGSRNGDTGGGASVSDEWVTRERSFRGISRRLAIKYLENLGAEQVDKDRVEADDWAATPSERTVGVGPSVSLTQVDLAFEGDPEGLDALIERFARKAMRAGG